MEVLGDKIKKFLDSGCDFDWGYDYSSSNGSGRSFGYGSGFNYGFGDFGNYDSDWGDGSGFSCGCGNIKGTGDGIGYNYGIKELNGHKVYLIDGMQTIFTSIHGNVAKGYVLHSNLQLEPCFIVKENDKFAHGDTLRDAFISLQEKLYDDSTEEERIEAFVKKFPEYDVKYDNKDLFAYHHILTGSCRMGRESFCKDKGLSLNGKTTVREFIELTQDAYGGDIIKKLPSAYGIKY